MGEQLLMSCKNRQESRASHILTDIELENVDYFDRFGYTPLLYACENGMTATVHLLLQRNARMDVEGDVGRTPLGIACFGGYNECALALVEHGASLDVVDAYDNTLLHLVCCGGCTSILPYFTNLKREIKRQNKDGVTPTEMCSSLHTIMHFVKMTFYLMQAPSLKVAIPEKRLLGNFMTWVGGYELISDHKETVVSGDDDKEDKHLTPIDKQYCGGNIAQWMTYTNSSFPLLKSLCRNTIRQHLSYISRRDPYDKPVSILPLQSVMVSEQVLPICIVRYIFMHDEARDTFSDYVEYIDSVFS